MFTKFFNMLKIKQKWGLVILLLISLISVLVYISDSSNEKDKIKEIYFADRITSAHQLLIDKYNHLNEDKIKVIPIDFPSFDFTSNEIKELLARSLRGRGDGIDLFAVDLIWVSRFAKWAEPLDQYFPINERSKILDYALESCYNGNDFVAIPVNLAQGVMYYREDLLRELVRGNEIIERINNQISWQEFIEIGTKIKSKHPFYIFPADDYEGLVCTYMELLLNQDPNYFTKNHFNLNTEQAFNALQILVDLVNKHKLVPLEVTNFSEVPSYDYFIKNDAVFIRGWQTYDKDFLEQPVNPEKEEQLRKTSLPYINKNNPVSVYGGWNLMISKFSDNKPEVIDFIKFLLSDESQEIFYKEAGFYPVNKSFYESDSFIEKYPEISGIIKMHELGIHRPAYANYTKYSKILSQYLKRAIKGDLDVKEALINATKEINMNKELLTKF